MKRSSVSLASFSLVCALCLLGVSGCAKSAPPASGNAPVATPSAPPAATGSPTLKAAEDGLAARKLVKNATLDLIVTSPAAVARRAEAIVRGAGGYVETSDNASAAPDERDAERNVELVLKVPADRLESVLAQIEKLAPGIESEHVKTQDVTDQYIDLSARLNGQQALEAQYLQILKNAARVQDALDVQKQLASVRTEIEKLEGQKRVLDHQIALSTITLTLSKRAPLVSATVTHFGESLRDACADAVNMGAVMITDCIRALGVLLPLILMVLLPLGFGFRWLWRRARRTKPAAA
jgi:Domain of unknown function (DUF4349)